MYDKAISINPNDAEAYLCKGMMNNKEKGVHYHVYYYLIKP